MSIPKETGEGFGKFEDEGRHHEQGERLFMCESSPRKAIALAQRLMPEGPVPRMVCEETRYRNTASDLVALGARSLAA